VAIEAITRRDDGTPRDPSLTGWDEWVSASATRAYALDDPILDWLSIHGAAKGFVSDKDLPGYDPALDFTEFLFRQGNLFEKSVMAHLAQHAEVEDIAPDYRDIRSLEKANATFEAMTRGVPLIYQGVLWDAEHAVYGAPDLLVRSDVLSTLFPGTISPEQAAKAAPDLDAPWHYRVVDVKFTGLHLLAGGDVGNSGSAVAYKTQLFLYTRALGRLQGMEPSHAYLLGRGWEQRSERGHSAIERLGPVPQDGTVSNRRATSELATAAVHWMRRVRAEGAEWDVLPEPTIRELYPDSSNQQDSPWSNAKRQIARELQDVTLLWQVGPPKREIAHAAGIRRWTDPRCTPAAVGVTGATQAPILQALLDINRSTDGLHVHPLRIAAAQEEWRATPPLEFYVDFETFSDLNDDFSAFPQRGGQALIFMVGCGHIEDGEWQFACFVAEEATVTGERRMIDAWYAHMDAVRQRLAPDLERPRVMHWSPAERSNFETAYNSARTRHPDATWADLNWFDFLARVMKAEPVVIRGSLAFGLKAVAKALHGHGLIQTLWSDGPADGLGAMVASWSAYDAARASSEPVLSIPLMQEVVRYNEVDCRVMWEAIAYLRSHH